MPPRKNGPKRKPKPSKEVLAMVKAVKAKKATYPKRKDSSLAAGQILEPGTEDNL